MDPFDAMLRRRLVRLTEAVPVSAPVGAVPDSDVRLAPTRMGASGWAGLTALIVIVVTISWLVLGRQDPPTVVPAAGDGGSIVWDSGLVRLEADSVRIETPNGTFHAIDVTPIPDPDSGTTPAGWSPSPSEPWDERPGIETVDFLVLSDPGDVQRTLEVTWQEAGVEMRLHLYLAADDDDWWVTEVRVYDGSTEGHRIGWGSSFGAPDADQDAVASDDPERRLRRFGVPTDAEVVAAGGGPGGVTSVVYRDARGRYHSIRCEGASEMKPADVTLRSTTIAPAALCPPPPVDLGLLRTPIGDTWTGDLDLVDGHAERGEGAAGELHIEGMRLSAFDD